MERKLADPLQSMPQARAWISEDAANYPALLTPETLPERADRVYKVSSRPDLALSAGWIAHRHYTALAVRRAGRRFDVPC